jgi:geranylgeranylglycerol-phosphate geranylgeranyltransferase
MKQQVQTIREDNKKPFRFLFRWRPFPLYELISYVLMFASVPILAYGTQAYTIEIIRIIILSIFTLYSGFFAALIWNDITDKDIDSIVHPNRPLPCGSITSKKFFAIALIFSFMTFLFAFLISVWCLILVGIAALFVAFHNKYLKKIIKFPAYSEIFTPIQWVVVAIFGYVALWTALPPTGTITISLPLFGYLSFTTSAFITMLVLVLFTYFADNAHDIPEGIHDVEGDRKLGVKTYATSFGEYTAAKISFIMFFISGILGISLFLRTTLTFVFLIPFLVLWVYILRWSYRLIKVDRPHLKELGKVVGRKGFNYLLFSYDLIFLDLFLHLLVNYSFLWL